MQKPLIEKEIWNKALNLNSKLKEAIINPNSDFMTKLLFDARFFCKKNGKEISYYTNLIFKIKMFLAEKKVMNVGNLSKNLNVEEKELKEIIDYLVNCGEILRIEENFSLNKESPYSKMFFQQQ
ncbi:MAG: hypothetical protein QXD98_03765 [Candidatus Diapherotrites archaeon]